jgi:hypothetical protein
MVQRLEKSNSTLLLNTDYTPESVLEEVVQHLGVAQNDGGGDDYNEYDEHDEVENGETNNTSLAQLGLLQ